MRKALIVLAVVFAAGAGFILTRPDSKSLAPATPDAKTDQPSTKALILGDPAAKLTIVSYGDFQCPRCNRFFNTIEPEIRRDFLDKGLAKIEWRNFATIGPESVDAAQAAHCANDQQFFPQFYRAVFIHMNNNYWAKGQDGENVGALSRAELKQLAAQSFDLINQAQFNKCLEKGTHKATVEDELRTAQSEGYSLNTYIIGKQIINGVQPYAIFKPVIQSQL